MKRFGKITDQKLLDTHMRVLKELLSELPQQKTLLDATGIVKSHLWLWKTGKRRVPLSAVLAIQKYTNSKYGLYDFYPDFMESIDQIIPWEKS